MFPGFFDLVASYLLEKDNGDSIYTDLSDVRKMQCEHFMRCSTCPDDIENPHFINHINLIWIPYMSFECILCGSIGSIFKHGPYEDSEPRHIIMDMDGNTAVGYFVCDACLIWKGYHNHNTATRNGFQIKLSRIPMDIADTVKDPIVECPECYKIFMKGLKKLPQEKYLIYSNKKEILSYICYETPSKQVDRLINYYSAF